jgi:NADH-quinone oxidoreductase subunit L
LVGLLAAGFIGVPLLGGLGLLALWLARRISAVNAWRSTAVFISVALLALAAGLVSGKSSLAMGEWLPGMGAMRFDLQVTALIPAIYITLAALLLWLVGCRPTGAGDRMGLKASLALLALATTLASFLAGHFLTRYVALELLGLCVAAAPAIWGVKGGLSLSGRTYLLLRIGDAGLLAGILLLRSGSGGALEIDQAIRSAVLLSPDRLAWIITGFLLVLWLKIGFWPVHIWNYIGQRLPLFPGAWIFATLMPNLGIYLLYRLVPVLTADAGLAAAVRWLGASLALVALALALGQSGTRPGIIRLLAGIGGLTLYGAASGQSGLVWLSLLVVTPLRPALMLLPPPSTQRQRRLWRSVFTLCGFSAALYGLLVVLAVHRTGCPELKRCRRISQQGC